MTTRALQASTGFWTHYREIDPTDEDTDWITNLQVWRTRSDGPLEQASDADGFQFTVVDNQDKAIAVHWLDAATMMHLIRWLQDGPEGV